MTKIQEKTLLKSVEVLEMNYSELTKIFSKQYVDELIEGLKEIIEKVTPV